MNLIIVVVVDARTSVDSPRPPSYSLVLNAAVKRDENMASVLSMERASSYGRELALIWMPCVWCLEGGLQRGVSAVTSIRAAYHVREHEASERVVA